MTQSALLEREALLTELQQHASEAFRNRSGRLLLVGGVAGAGKTALVQAFAATQAASTAVLRGACDPMSAPRPLGPLHDFARRLGSEFAGLVDAGDQRQHIFVRLLDALGAGPNLHLLIIEDLHWADDATLDLLRYLGRRLDTCRALLLGTYRDDEVGASHPLRRVLGDLAGIKAVHRLRVPELTEAGVRQLTAGHAVDAAALHRRTGGNPFFVTEVLAAGERGLPAKVEDAVLARAARLSPAARATLELAAVIGSTQELPLLESLAPTVAGVEECLASGMLTSSGLTLAFRHEIAREAVLGAMGPSRRRHCHAAVLAALEPADEAAGGEQETARGAGASRDAGLVALLAHHSAAAGDEERVRRYAPVAGRHAFKLGAFREAKVQFERVLPVASGMDPHAHADILDTYATACTATSDDLAAKKALAKALELRQLGADPARTALSLMRYGESLYNVGEKEAAEGLVSEAAELIAALPEGPERADIYRSRANLRMLDRDAPAALAWARKAVASGKRSGNLRAVANAYNVLVGVLTITERTGEALRYHRACLELIQEGHGMDPVGATANVKSMLGSGLGEVYRLREADAVLGEACDMAAQIDLDATHHYALAWRSLTHLYLGRWQEAGEAASWLLGRPNASLITRIMAGVALGRLRVRRGDPEAWPVLDTALAEALRTDTLQRLAPVRAARAEAALAAGDLDRAAYEAQAALELALAHEHRWFAGELVYLLRRAGGEAELPAWATGPFAKQARGDARGAASAWHRLGCRFEEARALAETDDVLLLRRALELFGELGAKPAAAKVAERLRAKGVRVPRGPRPPTGAHPAGLTAREGQVLQLLAAGLRNADIAARHGVSERTVGHQVSAVLAKLAVRSRTEAVAEAQRRGLLALPGPDRQRADQA